MGRGRGNEAREKKINEEIPLSLAAAPIPSEESGQAPISSAVLIRSRDVHRWASAARSRRAGDMTADLCVLRFAFCGFVHSRQCLRGRLHPQGAGRAGREPALPNAMRCAGNRTSVSPRHERPASDFEQKAHRGQRRRREGDSNSESRFPLRFARARRAGTRGAAARNCTSEGGQVEVLVPIFGGGRNARLDSLID